eukprot:COSAG02_NODE_26865_length_622_cov_0.931166_1_plen_76_part_10
MSAGARHSRQPNSLVGNIGRGATNTTLSTMHRRQRKPRRTKGKVCQPTAVLVLISFNNHGSTNVVAVVAVGVTRTS